MKKLILLLMAVVAIMACTTKADTVADKDLVSQERSLKGFERIRLYGSPSIKYTQGDTFSVKVKAPKDMIKKVRTYVEDDCLVVSMKGNMRILNSQWVSGDGVTVYVTSPDLIGVELHGSGDFESKGKVDTDNLRLTLHGSGNVKFSDIICDHVSTSLIGSGDIEIKNVEARNSSVELVGSGDVSIKQSRVAQTQIELKGSGDIKVYCDRCHVVNCRLVGSGDITLTGVVTRLNQTARGSGDIYTEGLQIKQNN